MASKADSGASLGVSAGTGAVGLERAKLKVDQHGAGCSLGCKGVGMIRGPCGEANSVTRAGQAGHQTQVLIYEGHQNNPPPPQSLHTSSKSSLTILLS